MGVALIVYGGLLTVLPPLLQSKVLPNEATRSDVLVCLRSGMLFGIHNKSSINPEYLTRICVPAVAAFRENGTTRFNI